jgi:hypothetical protein
MFTQNKKNTSAAGAYACSIQASRLLMRGGAECVSVQSVTAGIDSISVCGEIGKRKG